MKTLIDLEKWNRKEHFLFFSAFDDPFFGVTVNVDFTPVYEEAKTDGASFFLYSLHHILRRANEVEAFKLRIEEQTPVRFDAIHVSPTIAREDGTFGFGFFEYHPDRTLFIRDARQEIERVQQTPGLSMSENSGREDVIFFSSVPWFAFTEMKHAVWFGSGRGIPRISTGKLIREKDKYLLPVSICVHHGLMDGRDVAELIEKLSPVSKG